MTISAFSRAARSLAFAAAFGGIVSNAHAGDRILVLSGGYSASSNQVSLEKNVRFFRAVMKDLAPETPVTEYFSSGNERIPSVQFELPNAEVPPANEYMARLFGSTSNLKLSYRSHELGEVDGITSRANLDQWFKKEGAAMKAGDRLIIYATAHGGGSRDKKNPFNSTIYLWNRQSIDVQSLQKHLEGLPEGVSVVLIMAQCHSGGFAYSIFPGADPDEGDFDRDVCGFFATVYSREAAGCTPDIDEENYDEYSSHFWAAQRGKDRLNRPVESADYDGDGRVSFEEAHAYTILIAENIDIPMTASGAFLRERVKFGDDEGVDDEQLLNRKIPYSRVLALAGPVERAVLEGLSSRLGFSGEDRYAMAESKAGEIEKKREELGKKLKSKKGVFDGHRNAIRNTLLGKWPGLANVLTEQSVKLLTEDSKAFVAAVEAHPRVKEWNQLEEEKDKMEEERFWLEKDWAPCIRFMRVHNNVVLAENLKQTGSEKDQSIFARMRKAESQSLGDRPVPEKSD